MRTDSLNQLPFTETITDAYWRKLFKILSIRATNSIGPSFAEDMASESIFKLTAAIARGVTFESEVQFKSYAFRILENLRADHFRRHRGRHPDLCYDLTFENQASSFSYDHIDDGIDAGKDLDDLSGPDRGLLQKHYLDGLTVEEIAQAQGTTVGAMKSKFHRLKGAIQRNWEKDIR